MLQYTGWIKVFYICTCWTICTQPSSNTLSQGDFFFQVCMCKTPLCNLLVSASGLFCRCELSLVSAARSNVAGIQLVSALVLHSKLTLIFISYFALKCSRNTLPWPPKTNMFYRHCQDGLLNWENTSRRCFLWEFAFPSVVGNTPYIPAK